MLREIRELVALFLILVNYVHQLDPGANHTLNWIRGSNIQHPPPPRFLKRVELPLQQGRCNFPPVYSHLSSPSDFREFCEIS